MDFVKIIHDKATKSKEKAEIISNLLLNTKNAIDEIISFAETAKDPIKAICMEAIEFATKQKPVIANKKTFLFLTEALTSKSPRVKWESAKSIANTASLFPEQLENAIKNLIDNADHEGTVVRWSAALALGEIIQLKTKHNKKLIPVIEEIINKEKKNSIRKIYQDALKKMAK
jgi:HEAT repeat protein